MDVKAYLLELGYSEEDATTLSSDTKMAKAITTAAQKYEEANTLAQQTTQQKTELEKWWKETAQPAILNADGGSAAAKAEAARYKTYIADLKEKGYPVPDDWTKDPVTPAPAPTPAAAPTYLDPQKAAMEMAQATARLHDLSVEYQELYGAPLANTYGLLEEARNQNKPLTDYVRSKFNFDQKRTELNAKKESDRVAAITRDIEQKLEAKYAERANPNLAPAVVSRAVQVAEANKEHADSWKTKVGRTEAKRDRLSTFRNVVTKIA